MEKVIPVGRQSVSPEAADHLAQARSLLVVVPEQLHSDSKQLVQLFAEDMARKLRAAEEKYGHRNGWLLDHWEDECRKQLQEHLRKGDPMDVAIYAAFLWARGWPAFKQPRLRRPTLRR